MQPKFRLGISFRVPELEYPHFFLLSFFTLHDNTGVGSNTRPELSSLLPNRASDGGSLHFTLVVDNHTSVVLKVEVDTVGPSPGLALTDNNSGHDLLTKLRLSLLDGGHDHVTNTRSGETVETGTKTRDRDDVQVASSGVVAAVQHGAAVKHRRKPLAQNIPIST